jgi:hypothetical protein
MRNNCLEPVRIVCHSGKDKRRIVIGDYDF